MRYLSRRREILAGTPEYGHLFEALVHHELRCYLDFAVRDGQVEYWRTANGTEVDFVVGDCAIEAKSTENVAKGDLKGLKAIADEGVFAHRIVVCREPCAREVDGIEIMPYRMFVERLWAGAIIGKGGW